MSIQSRSLTCRSRSVAAVVALAVSALSNTGVSQAAAPRIPATYYPSGASISYVPTLSNHRMDCLWGFFCEGHVTLFHNYTQDMLHRTGGWAQFAGLHKHGRMLMSFELFASHYQVGGDLEGTPFGKEAFDDLIQVTHEHGYTRLSQQPHLLPPTARGGSIAEVQRSGSSELTVMACWNGTQEVEAVVLVDHGSVSDRRSALSDLTVQVLRAAGTK